MNEQDDADLSIARGFFHTMVVMGSALALGCGGESQSKTDVPAGVAGMGVDGAGGGAGNGAAGSPHAGSGSVSLGGSPGAGGSAAPGGMGGSAPVLDCPPTQWSCSSTYECSAYQIPGEAGCVCDAKRPKDATDCAADESFACMSGVQYSASGTPLETPVPYQCECVPRQTDCNSVCSQLQNGNRLLRCVGGSTSGTDAVLCDCAPIVLK